MICDSIGRFGAQKRQFVFLLWHIIVLALYSSSANCFASTTSAATTPNHRRHRSFSKTSLSQTPSSSTILQMVASTPPRGGSTILPQPPSQPPLSSTTISDDTGRWRKIRQAVFPIHGKHEVTKFLLIGAMKFFIILALTLTRDTKDTLVVTQCGAEAIAFLKVRRILKMSTLFVAVSYL